MASYSLYLLSVSNSSPKCSMRNSLDSTQLPWGVSKLWINIQGAYPKKNDAGFMVRLTNDYSTDSSQNSLPKNRSALWAGYRFTTKTQLLLFRRLKNSGPSIHVDSVSVWFCPLSPPTRRRHGASVLRYNKACVVP